MYKHSVATFVLFILGITFNLHAKEYTNYYINSAVSGNFNLNISDFQALPGTTTCCGNDSVNFKNATGWGWSLGLGVSKDFPQLFPSLNTRMTLNLGYTNFTANFAEDGFIGNYIEGDNVDEAWSKNKINTSINSILLHYLFAINPIKKVPLFLGLGLKTGINFSGSFDQSEEMLRPANAYFENNSKVRNQIEGSLEDLSPLYFALTANINIDLLHVGDFIIAPQVSFDYGVTDFMKNISWKNSSINLGVNLAYHVPKPETAPTEPAAPKLPIPTKKQLALITNVYDESNKMLGNNENILINTAITETINTEDFLLFLFFATNSNQIISGYSEKFMQYLSNQGKTDVVIGMAYDENNPELGAQRKQAIMDLLQSHSANMNNFSFSFVKSEKKQKYEQIEEEKAFAEFKFAAKENMQIMVEKRDTIINIVSPYQLYIKSQALVDASTYDYTTRIYIAEKRVDSSKNENHILTINGEYLGWENNLVAKKATIYCNVIDSEKNEANQVFNFNIIPKISKVTYTNSNANNYYTDEFVLGFFDFDRTNFISIDEKVADKARKHLENSGKIEILGYTDNLGTKQYNSTLAYERAVAGATLIDNENKFMHSIAIDASSKSRADNLNPYNRIQNRVAVIRFLK